MKKKIKAIIRLIPGFDYWFFRWRTWYYSRMNPKQYPNALKRWYKRQTGETLDLENPRTYNQKIQWLKLYDSTALKTELADKYKVRQWVADKIGEEYLIPLLGVWKNANDIDFNALPNQFVLKANHGSGWNIIVKDKSKLNVKETRKQLKQWLKMNFAFMSGFELHYKTIPPVIIAEKYMENTAGDLPDYKFLCFDGEPKYCWVDIDRHTSHHKRIVYDLKWQLQPFTILYPMEKKIIDKPENFDQMVSLARILCAGFKHVRVDFYRVNGKIYFGEMTFTSESGRGKISPPEYDLILGDMIKL